ncbi:uncharacterized protein CLUP02_15868 [Colletotrichum lupini]|uniref:Uncharacterized protein n=1 Tax=Colletotrichum lupini TaxID=145971 RepID=A0A9Q8WNP5_9PEZI|nr:uncharacterized protein CLUP02_15868 [Colletotrichum lupini]UQC90338.1 hypothetical protein CLUP02_15868 [Colletotrichum lupini]
MDDHPGDLHCFYLDCIYTRVLAPEEPRLQGSWAKRDDDDDFLFCFLWDTYIHLLIGYSSPEVGFSVLHGHLDGDPLVTVQNESKLLASKAVDIGFPEYSHVKTSTSYFSLMQ